MNNSIPYLQYFTNNFNENLSVEFLSWLQEEENPMLMMMITYCNLY
jgi:hypothetical protein